MRKALTRTVKFRLFEPVRQLAEQARTSLEATRTLRLLVASDDLTYPSEQQLAPLYRQREVLRRELGVVFGHLLVRDALLLPLAVLRSYDAVLLKLGFETRASEALAIVTRMRERAGPGVRLVYLDGDDDACVQWPDVLRHVDLYVKKHVFRDRDRYLEPHIGKSNLTDHAARSFGATFDGDIIPSTPAVDARHLGRITLGWSAAFDDKIVRHYDPARRGPPDETRDIDVFCRASLEGWIRPFRWPVVPVLRRLEPRHRVVTPLHRVPQSRYDGELRRSRICVSPFGYGEVCWRDFEAILAGALLVKPDVGHLETYPDIYVPHRTYVPVRWDFRDLEDVLRHYLAHPRELDEIRRRAYAVLDDAYRSRAFERRLGEMLRLAGLAPQAQAR